MLLRNPCKNLKSYDNPFWKNSDDGRKKEKEKEKEEKKSMIIVVPSCLKDADGARTRSDQHCKIYHKSEYVWFYYDGKADMVCFTTTQEIGLLFWPETLGLASRSCLSQFSSE